MKEGATLTFLLSGKVETNPDHLTENLKYFSADHFLSHSLLSVAAMGGGH